jgi:hypothetical protein
MCAAWSLYMLVCKSLAESTKACQTGTECHCGGSSQRKPDGLLHSQGVASGGGGLGGGDGAQGNLYFGTSQMIGRALMQSTGYQPYCSGGGGHRGDGISDGVLGRHDSNRHC